MVTKLGFTHVEELVGRRILEFTHPDHRADWIRLRKSLWAYEMTYFMLETCLGPPKWDQLLVPGYFRAVRGRGRRIGATPP